MRLLTYENKGAGYIDDGMNINWIIQEYRNLGIGKKMMIRLIDDVRGKVTKFV